MEKIILGYCKECDNPLTHKNRLPTPYALILECDKCGYPNGPDDYPKPMIHIKCDLCGIQTVHDIGHPIKHDCMKEMEEFLIDIFYTEGQGEEYEKFLGHMEQVNQVIKHMQRKNSEGGNTWHAPLIEESK